MNEQQKIQAIIEIVRQGSGATDAKRDLEGVVSASGLLDDKLKALSQTLAATFTAGTLARFAAESVRAFADSEAGLNRLNNTLKASGQFSQAYVTQLRELADAFAEVTRADDDAILSAERTLIQFGAQRKDMERLTRATLDLSTALGMDLQQAANLVGRAVSGETAAFERFGFQVNSSADAGDRLNSVIQQIEARFAGLANADTGELLSETQQLAKAWDDVKKNTGAWLAEAVRPAIGALRELLAQVNTVQAQVGLGKVDTATRAMTASRLDIDLMNAAVNDPSRADEIAKLQAALRSQFNAYSSAGTFAYPRSGQDFNAETLRAQDEAVRRAMDALNYTPAALRQAEAAAGAGDGRVSPAPWVGSGGRATGEQFGPPNPFTGEMFGPTDAEANTQRRKLAREAADEIKALEQSLTLESIRAGDFRLGKVQEEYNHRVDLYRRLYSEHKLSEDELTSLTRDAAFERDRAIEESIQRQRELERQAHEERLREWRQVTAQIQQTIASNVSGALVNAFRQGKFEADKFFSDLFAQIAQLIIQMLILRALRGIFGTAMAEGGAVMAAGGLPPTFAAGGLDGVTALNHATYHPRFNVIAGEAGLEMMTVLSRPRPMAFGGVEAVTGFARGRELAVMPAGGAAMLAAGQSGNTGRIVIDVNLDPGLRANITQEAVAGAEVRLTQQAGRDSEFRRAITNARG